MKKRWFNFFLGIALGILFINTDVFAVDRNHYSNQNLNLPLEQIGQNGKQQTKNNGQKLFQTSTVGDIGKERQNLEKKGRKEVFQSNLKTPNPYTQKHVFKKHIKVAKQNYDYTKQTKSKKNFHFNYWIIIFLGILIGLFFTWRMLRSEKNE